MCVCVCVCVYVCMCVYVCLCLYESFNPVIRKCSYGINKILFKKVRVLSTKASF